MYSYKVEQAIRAAAILHRDQTRMGSIPFPYITHLVAVAFILSDYTDDENVLAAALLHDTLEDTSYTEKELRSDFGDTVADIVKTVTEPKTSTTKKYTWLEKKQRYASQLNAGSQAALMVAAADKAHNFRTLVEEYYDNPQQFTKDFGPNHDERLKAYQLIANVIETKLENDIVHEFTHTFTEFKKFLTHVKEQN